MNEKIEHILFSNKFYNVMLKWLDRLHYPVVSYPALLRQRREEPVPFNKIANVADITNPQWRELLEDMGESFAMDESRFHRKTWEHVHIVYVMNQLGYLRPENNCLSIGAGREPVLYYLAHKMADIVGIDIYEGQYLGGEDETDVMVHPAKYAPFVYPEENLELVQMDALDLTFPDNHFDVIFSASSIEHFGTPQQISKSIAEMERVLKPGGLCVITTELALNRIAGNIPNTRIFRLQELLDMFERNGFQLDTAPVDIAIEDNWLHDWVKLPQEIHKRPHAVLRYLRTVFTSVALAFTKPGDSVSRGEASVGTEIAPLNYSAEINLSGEKDTFQPGEQATWTLTIDNTSNFDWYCGGGSHRIALGVRLLDGYGNLLDMNFFDSPLPQNVKRGESVSFDIALDVPAQPGHYQLMFDLKRELITWFSDRGSAPVTIDIRLNG